METVSLDRAQRRRKPFFAVCEVGGQFTAQYHVPGITTLRFGDFPTTHEAEAACTRQREFNRDIDAPILLVVDVKG